MVKPKIHRRIHHENYTFYDVWRFDGVGQGQCLLNCFNAARDMRVTDSTQQHNSEYRTMQTAVQLSVCQLVTLFNERPPSSISSPTPSTSRGHRSHTPALPYQYQPAPS